MKMKMWKEKKEEEEEEGGEQGGGGCWEGMSSHRPAERELFKYPCENEEEFLWEHVHASISAGKAT